jgi:hypothetical protein
VAGGEPTCQPGSARPLNPAPIAIAAESPFTTLQTEQRSPLRGPGVGCLGVILSSRRSSRSRSRHPSCRGAERAAGSGPPGSAPRKPTKMPGLTAPSDYAEEPPRHPALKINAKVSATPSSPRVPRSHPPGDLSDWVRAL